MVQTKYFCNLCTEEKPKGNLLCVYFDSTLKVGERFGGYTLHPDVTKAPKHICKDCLKMVNDFTEQNKTQ